MRTSIASLLGRTPEPDNAPAGEPVLLIREQMDEVAGGITTATASFSNIATGTRSASGTGTVAVSTQTSGGVSTGSIYIGLTGTATG
jgi:hypothetical protein